MTSGSSRVLMEFLWTDRVIPEKQLSTACRPLPLGSNREVVMSYVAKFTWDQQEMKLALKIRKRFPYMSGVCPGKMVGFPKGSISLGMSMDDHNMVGDYFACSHADFKLPPVKGDIWIRGVYFKLAIYLQQFGYRAECKTAGYCVAYPIYPELHRSIPNL